MRLNKSIVIALCLAMIFPASLLGQAPKKHNAAEIQLMLKKLNVLGTALYIAAHPDDENTRMIAYLANEALYNTAYLSTTRGDGGQNLVGPEIRELLGLIRTQELLAARRTDGGNQFFTRANDFGYSKNPDETFNIWDKEQVLSDFVWVIRNYKPDVIITRFPESGGGGHGHHTASALLTRLAYEAAGDKKRFPDQLDQVDVWTPKRWMFNTHWWFYGSKEKMDTTELMHVDLGTYNPLLGKSYSEIASSSRSMHKSQGFGSTGTRGTQVEYLEFQEGEKPVESLFEGIDSSWGRVKGGDKVAVHTENAMQGFDPGNPSLIVDDLVKAYVALDKVKDDHWKTIKQKEIKDIIKACMGLYIEIKANSYAYTPGDSIKLSVEAINRSDVKASLSSINIEHLDSFELNQMLHNNSPVNVDKQYKLPSSLTYSDPYWLRESGTLGMYSVKDRNLRGTPENKPALNAFFTIEINDAILDFEVPVIYKRNDPVDGEVYRPLEITPPVFLNIEEKVYVFGDQNSKEVTVKVTAGKNDLKGSVRLNLPEGWTSSPETYDFDLPVKDQETIVSFSLTPPAGQQVGEISATANIGDEQFDKSRTSIEYDHIPVQTLFPTSGAKVVKVDLKRRGQNIGYIMGAGDEIPASLRQIGYNVWEMKDEDITAENLSTLDAVILGVRAYNTRDRIKFYQDLLMKYVKAGGNMIVQYNTSHRLVTENLAPYSLKLSRDRVTVEEAEIRILKPDHPLLNVPNKITDNDFNGWVQERGLYFPNEWDENFEALLSSNDPDETPKDGGLLVTKYGKGHYIYSGYSWFRQLPAGVPGAYRLFTNMISIGKQEGLKEETKLDLGH